MSRSSDAGVARYECGRNAGQRRILTGWPVVIAAMLTAGPFFRVRAAEHPLEVHLRRELAPLEGRYASLRASLVDDEHLTRFVERLRSICDVGIQLADGISLLAADSVQDLVSDDGRRTVDEGRARAAAVRAGDIYRQHAAQFAEPLSKPNVAPEQFELLLTYYHATISAAQDYLFRKARTVAAADDAGGESAVQLCLVLPLLSTPDERWNAATLHSMPPWLRRPRARAAAASLALAVERPLVAHLFHTRPDGAAQPKAQFLRESADRLIGSAEYHAAMRCLTVGIEISTTDARADDIIDFRLRLAKMMSDLGHASMAADEVGRALAVESAPKDLQGKAAMFRLKYLFEAERLDEVLNEAPALEASEACAPYLPQILYINWIANRRLGNEERAVQIQERFIAAFPQNPLCADLYFASAMAALAASNYPETLRLLEIIQYRYPTASVVKRAKELQQRLEKMR